MNFSKNFIRRKTIPILLIAALNITGLFSCHHAVYADSIVLSEQTYYHLDLGIQLAYNSGCDWGNNHIYNSPIPIMVSTTITFNSSIEVLDTYPLNSAKGNNFEFNGNTSSHNIPKNLGSADSAYSIFYADYVSTSMTEGSCSSSGNYCSFNYTARLNTIEPLEVVSYGEDSNDNLIYQLFGGKSALEDDQPEIADAIATALEAGANGTAGSNKLYLIFCPNVIEYKKYIVVGDLEARLDLPSSAKQGENYTASDTSIVADSLTVDTAILEKHDGDGIWEEVTIWDGTGIPGENTGGRTDEVCDEISTITYRLTVTTTNDQVDTDTKTIQITDGREIEGQAILELPAYTYEGHPALARDVSEFAVDGVDYSARRAYEEGIASNRFRPLPSGSGSAARESLTTANVVFPRKGNYNVRLDIDTINGNTLTDTKPIEVRKTPYILDNLGGFQKQNRKQILNIAVATYPGKPIIDYYIKLRDLKTGEEITLTQDQPQQNNATIKTRTHTKNGDQYWTQYCLEFLTKTPVYDPAHPDAVQIFQYTIFMEDSKGDTDTVQKTFTVVPDLPPNAQITIQDSFIRNQGSNIAEIVAEDSSTTDGDQLQRSWTARGTDIQTLPGFKDHSFGSRQNVQYNKTGVGKETVGLFVKDVWIEPTLEEYISESDYLSSTTTAATEVVNIAPTVRLEPVKTETADIAIVTEKASENGIKAGINSMRAALIEAGIDANIQVIPTAKPNDDGYKRAGSYTWKAAINDQTQQSTGLVFDSEYAYVVEAAGFQMSGYQEVAIRPYTVKALKKSTTEGGPLITVWSYTVAESSNFRLKTDSSEKYIYLACNDTKKTILLNRNNGAYVTSLPVVIPDHPYTTSSNNNLYFLSGDKIQKYDPDTGTLKTVINKGGTLGRIQDGKLTFVGKEGDHKFYIGQFDMNTEIITQKSIPALKEYVYNEKKSSVSPTDMDRTGKVTFTQTLTDRNNDKVGVIIWLADAEAQSVYHLGKVAATSDLRTNSVGFVKDETGKAVYMYHGMHDDSSTSSTTRRYWLLYVYTLGNGDAPPVKREIYRENNKKSNSNGISYAKYHSQENAIYLMQGAEWQGPDWDGNQPGVSARIQLPSWSVNFDKYDWGWDVADEEGRWNDYLMMTYYNYDNWVDNDRRIKMFTNSITKEQAEESALTRFADFSQDVARYIEKSFTNTQELVDKVKEAVKEKVSLRLNASSGTEISLSRNFILKAGQTYYYEFEVKKPDIDGETPEKINVFAPQITFDTPNVYEGSGNLESYFVTDIIEENFNGTLNPFFTLTEGRITDGLQTPTKSKTSSSQDVITKSTVAFTIPEGKTAVALMDVSYEHNSISRYDDDLNTTVLESGWKSGAYINGKRYDRMPGDSLKVDGYLHPYPLKAGVNTITAQVCDRTNELDTLYTKIDNLKIIFLEKTPDTTVGCFSATQTEDGWTKATGSFQAPEKITKFHSQEMQHYPDWPSNMIYTVNNNYKYYDYVIPAGKVAKVHATFQGGSSRDDSVGGTFYFPGWRVVHRGTSDGSSLTYVWSGNNYFVGTMQGSVRLSTLGTNSRTASFSTLETYVYPANLKDKYSFFFKDDKVYSVSNTFEGKTGFRINLNTDSADNGLLMQNLRIYYINNGNKIYLYNKSLENTADLSGWEITENATANMYSETKPEKEEEAPLVYKKGQLVFYELFYDDYEDDPSKKQYWRYTHTPYNDGPHPHAAFILDEDGNVVSSADTILTESIPRFYIDGKYTVEHWQEDNTNRIGEAAGAGNGQGATDYSLYDKLSNVESITFYVEGGGTAPWITFIKTIPATVKEGDDYRLQIGMDDAEKDPLRLTTELYKEKKLIYTHRQTDILADANGVYPEVTTGFAPTAQAGKYEVVCTVRDWSGAGIGSYRFTVISEGRINGFVNHTDQWDENRKKYNLQRFDEEGNRPMQLGDYIAMSPPRLRGTNVFWSGEKFMLQSETEGKPSKVDAQIFSVSEQGIRKNTGYSTQLTNTGRKKPSGEELWEGVLWEKEMINRWGRRTPEQLLFVFTAYYADGKTKTNEVTILVDSRQDYWQLHRLW